MKTVSGMGRFPRTIQLKNNCTCKKSEPVQQPKTVTRKMRGIDMSLWYESLGQHLGNNLEENAKIILAFLSMRVPRSWWEHALQTGSLGSSYIGVLKDLQKNLVKLPELSARVDYKVLVALAFIDDGDNTKDEFGDPNSRHSIEDYIDRANKVLIERPEVNKLGEVVAKRAHVACRPD